MMRSKNVKTSTTFDYSAMTKKHNLRSRLPYMNVEQKEESMSALMRGVLGGKTRSRNSDLRHSRNESVADSSKTETRRKEKSPFTIRIPPRASARGCARNSGTPSIKISQTATPELTPPRGASRPHRDRARASPLLAPEYSPIDYQKSLADSDQVDREYDNTSYCRTNLPSSSNQYLNYPSPSTYRPAPGLNQQMKNYFEEQLRAYDLQQDTHREFMQHSLEEFIRKRLERSDKEVKDSLEDLIWAVRVVNQNTERIEAQQKALAKAVDGLYGVMDSLGVETGDVMNQSLQKELWPDEYAAHQMIKYKRRWMRRNDPYAQPFEEWRRSPGSRLRIPPGLIVAERDSRYGAEHLPVVTAASYSSVNALDLVVDPTAMPRRSANTTNSTSAPHQKRSRDLMEEPSMETELVPDGAERGALEEPTVLERSPCKRMKISPVADLSDIPGLTMQWAPVNYDAATLVHPMATRPWVKIDVEAKWESRYGVSS